MPGTAEPGGKHNAKPASAEQAAGAVDARRDRAVTRALAAWFSTNARPLPWRTDIAEPPTPRNPYHNLVAEAMAQQTQLSRVVPSYQRFIARFPTVATLAAAHLDEVLALWSGLGYYRRARHLHAAARAIVDQHGGGLPGDAATLASLPGVGRYTAGSLASIVFGQRTPLVDGNVARVLLRLEGRADLTTPKAMSEFAWKRAEQLVAVAASPARFNEGLMELGATICAAPPATPDCGSCPLARWCKARAQGTQGTIPVPKKARPPTTLRCAVLVSRDSKGRLLVEQRPATGMWAGMWQCPTLERTDAITPADFRAFAQLRSLDAASLKPLGEFIHQTTHRTLRFAVYSAAPVTCLRKSRTARWIKPEELNTLALSNAQRKALALAGVKAG